ncbi:thioesterase II family protein [Streptomyces sp. P1-3]|uniref:thioesterase II family protein n=1 Tax=Streptomyces sp. P1-3 TaxID=3421658 RepID=UPI003D368506
MQPSAVSPWFPGQPMTSTPELCLFCLPHAGAGASTYRDWQRLLGPRIEVVPVQLPGREGRFTEPAERSIRRLSERLLEPVVTRAGAVPFAFFGHSMGALLAYDLSNELARLGSPPAHLAVSGYAPPHARAANPVHTLPDKEFLEHVINLEGTAPDLLDSPQLLELLLPVLRDDFAACETYEYVERGPLRVPLTAFGGHRDPGVGVALLERWRELTTGTATVEVFPGGHFYLLDQVEQVLETLAARLGAAREAGLA